MHYGHFRVALGGSKGGERITNGLVDRDKIVVGI